MEGGQVEYFKSIMECVWRYGNLTSDAHVMLPNLQYSAMSSYGDISRNQLNKITFQTVVSDLQDHLDHCAVGSPVSGVATFNKVHY